MSPDESSDGAESQVESSDQAHALVVLVTGASHGIGAAIARRLTDDGSTVVAAVQTEALADEVRGRSHPDVMSDVVAADLRDRDACRSIVDGCVQRHGRIDVLVNNAAITGAAAKSPLTDYTDDAFDELMDVNVGAAFRCSRHAARHMVDNGGGLIINIGSVAGFVAQFEAVPYSMSKSALLALTRGIALELGRHGVRSVYVAPGDIDTGVDVGTGNRAAGTWQRSTPLGRRGTPADVASVVSFLCSPDARFVSGTSWAVDGGWLSY